MFTLSKSPGVPSTFLTKHSAAKLYKVSRITFDKRIAGKKLSTYTDELGRFFLDPSELQRLFGARDGSTADVAMLSAQDIKAADEGVEIAENVAQVAKQEVDSLRRDQGT